MVTVTPPVGTTTAVKGRQRVSATGPLLMLGIWILFACALGLADQAYSVSYGLQIVVLSLMLFGVGIILAAVVARPLTLRASLVQLKLGPWVAIGFAVVFGLASLTWLKEKTGTEVVVDRSLLVAGGAVALLGLAAMLVGYRFCPSILVRAGNRVDRALRGARAPQFTLAGPLLLWSISVVVQAANIANGSFGYLSDPTKIASSSLPELLFLFSQLGVVATLFAAWLYASIPRRPAAGLVLILVLGTQLILGFFSAQKEPFVVQFIAAFIGYGVQRRVRLIPVLSVAAAFVLFVTPFVTLYRTDVVTNSGGRLSPTQVLANVSFGGLASKAVDSSRNNPFDEFAQRVSRVGDVTVIIQKTPGAVPYRSPLELFQSPVLGVIPRSLWHSKPVLDAGYRMSYLYYDLPQDVHTSNAPTPYGDLWWHGGLLAVLAGMIPLGFLARVVDSREGYAARDPRMLFLPILLFLPMVKQETDYVSFAASLVGTVLVAALAARLVAAVSDRNRKVRRSFCRVRCEGESDCSAEQVEQHA